MHDKRTHISQSFIYPFKWYPSCIRKRCLILSFFETPSMFEGKTKSLPSLSSCSLRTTRSTQNVKSTDRPEKTRFPSRSASESHRRKHTYYTIVDTQQKWSGLRCCSKWKSRSTNSASTAANLPADGWPRLACRPIQVVVTIANIIFVFLLKIIYPGPKSIVSIPSHHPR